MQPIKRILCPIDFSDTAKHAFDYADDFAASVSAELIVAHAFDRPEKLDPAEQTKPADHRVLEQLENVRSKHPAVHVSHAAHAGDAGEVIAWLAQQRHCELIIMGTHGHTGWRHLLLGSTAEYVLRHARCPVLTIRLPRKEAPLSEPRVVPLPPPRFM